MTTENVNSLPGFFEALYGKPILKDATLCAALVETEKQLFTIGQTIPRNITATDTKAILLDGKIRVLYKQGGKEQTVLLLTAGDIWDLAFLDKKNLTLTVSSDNAVVCTLNASLVLENPILCKQWESVSAKDIAIIVPEPANGLKPSTEIATIASLDQTYAAVQHAAQVTTTSVTVHQLLAQILTYFKKQIPAVLPDTGIAQDLKALSQLLDHSACLSRQTTMSWNQLLNTDYPLVLVDETGAFHWVTGRQGNTLLEDHFGEAQRYIPKEISNNYKYAVLFVKASYAKKVTNASEPYSMSWYLNLFFQNWFLSSQMVVSSVLVQLFSLGMPIFYIVIFDRVFGRQNLNTLDVMGIGIMMMLIFDLMVKLLRSYVLSHQLEFIDKVSLDNFLDRVFNIPLAKSTPQITRSFTERFPEIARMNQALASTLMVTSLDVVFSVILVIFLLCLNTQLAFISLSSLIPIALLSFWSSPVTKKRAMQFAQEQRVCQMKLTEALEHKETIQSLNANTLLKWNLAQKFEEYLQRGFTARYDRVSGSVGQGFIASVGAIVTLYFGAHEVLQGEISYGVYMAINMLSRQVIGSVQKLFASMLQFQEAMATMEQFKGLYQPEKEELPTQRGIILPHVAGRIQVNDLRFRYQQESPWVLNNINLDIQPGQKIVLTGKSGSGKTSLLRLLQRLYEPQSGHIALDSFNIADIDPENLRQHIGVALQRPAIFAGTIRENIALGNYNAPMKDIIEAATMAQLDQDLMKLPKGLDTPLAPMGANLSGGQVARIAMARIFLIKPSILIIDEALTACDFSMNGSIFAHILEKYRQSTCIFVTSFLPVHEKADLILVLNEGQIVERGTYRELIQTQGYYAHLHHAQLSVGRD